MYQELIDEALDVHLSPIQHHIHTCIYRYIYTCIHASTLYIYVNDSACNTSLHIHSAQSVQSGAGWQSVDKHKICKIHVALQTILSLCPVEYISISYEWFKTDMYPCVLTNISGISSNFMCEFSAYLLHFKTERAIVQACRHRRESSHVAQAKNYTLHRPCVPLDDLHWLWLQKKVGTQLI